MDVFERLAVKLDQLPNGFPRTGSGVEIRILKKIFHPEEAEAVIKMSPLPESAEKIAGRLAIPVEGAGEYLDRMVRRGLIGTSVIVGQRVYFLLPFVVGIYEGQRNVLDQELAEMGQEYMPVMMKVLGGFNPPIGRIIPVGMQIDGEVKVHQADQVRRMIDQAVAFNLKNCICRKGKRLVGQSCKHLKDDDSPVGCLAISKDPDAFSGPTAAIMGENITKEEALQVLAEAEKAGCVHMTFNTDPDNWQTVPICNCCECCCEFMHAINTVETPHMLAKDQVAFIDADNCTGCGICEEESCPVHAISEDKDSGTYRVTEERCIGCGVCTIACPARAIAILKTSEEAEKPAHLFDWYAKRAAARGLEFPSTRVPS
jgi:Na+-translocating ferredoxin:NAD+ oxidoreductase RNF subunit RnfB